LTLPPGTEITDPQGYQFTATELAVYRQLEQGQIARLFLDL
jgi:hypothetical protein